MSLEGVAVPLKERDCHVRTLALRGTSRVGLFAFRFTPQAVVRQPRRLTKLGASSSNLPIRHGTYRSAPRFKYTRNFGWQRQQELQLWFGSLH